MQDAGVEGNARLTGATGALLVVLLLVEGLTILRVRALITPHIFVGLMLVPPVLLKIGATGYRFARYYTGREPYRRKGPPNMVLRVTGPFVVGLTVLVLATGIALIPYPRGLVLTAHKASFVLWFFVTALHVLGHLQDTARLAWRDWRPAPGRSPGRAARRLALVAVLVAGVGLGAAVLPAASAWTHGRTDIGFGGDGGGG